eukprot:3279605-Amphidinium_carterae.1
MCTCHHDRACARGRQPSEVPRSELIMDRTGSHLTEFVRLKFFVWCGSNLVCSSALSALYLSYQGKSS